MITFLLLSLITLASANFDASECGKAKHCLSVPTDCHLKNNGKNCEYMLSHTVSPDDENSAIIELYGVREDSAYVAAGFSDDDRMGNEPVTACVASPNGSPELSFSFNKGTNNVPIIGVSPNDGEILESKIVDGSIYCKIRQSIAPEDDALPDLKKPYQVLLARGPRQQDGRLQYHGSAIATPKLSTFNLPAPQPLVAPSQDVVDSSELEANATTTQAPTLIPTGSGPFNLTTPQRYTLLRFHALMMLIGWFGLIAVGIAAARYLRHEIVNKKVNGLFAWFQVHRAANVLGVFCILIGSLLAFISKDFEWTGPTASGDFESNTNAGAVHTLVGAISVIIALMQPLGSLLRCAPDSSKRPIFNWGHRILGLFGIILALVAVYIGVAKFKGLWNDTDWPLVVLILFTVLSVVLIAALEAYVILRDRRRNRVNINGMELSGRGKFNQDGYEVSYNPTGTNVSAKDKIVNLIGFSAITAASIAMVVLLGVFLF
uniref:ascorbate ferrireductase (transmembrane) n=1 Tax=Panagrellus redivivus TaxID=6233 RepID=A0A7E4UPX9_PANRE